MANPIIHRELVGMLRTGRAVVLQVLLVVVLSALVILRWPNEGRVAVSGLQAQQVLSVFGYGLMVALILLAPVFPATSIVRERQQGTLALLLNSPMSGLAILVGKLIGTVGFVLLLLLLSTPAAAACYTMGGVDLVDQLLHIYVILFLAALQFATLGMVVSTYAATTESSLRVTYGLILVLCVLTLGPHQFLQGLLDAPIFAKAVNWFRCFSPIPAMLEALHHGDVESRGTAGLGNVAGRYAMLSLVLTGVFIGWTLARLNFRLFDRARPVGKITDERSTVVRAYRRFMFLWFFDPKRRTGLIGPMSNPVMVKESRSRRFGRSHWLMRLIGFCTIVSLTLMLAATSATIKWGAETLGTILVLMTVGLIILMTPTLASGLISGERESGGWKMLMMTPLAPFTIITGKLLSVVMTLALLLVAVLPAYALLYHIDVMHKLRIAETLICQVMIALFALLLSAAISSLFRRTATATTVSYGLLVGLCAGTLLFWLGYNAPFTRPTVEAALMINPLAGALTLIAARGFSDFELFPAHWWFLAGGCVVSILVLSVQTWRLSRPQ